MAFLGRGVGRQRQIPAVCKSSTEPKQDTSGVGFPALTLALGLGGTLPKWG